MAQHPGPSSLACRTPGDAIRIRPLTFDPFFYCRLHGLVLASGTELPVAPVAPTAFDIKYRVALAEPISPSTHERSDNPSDPWAIERWAGSSVIVEFPQRATFELNRTEILLRRDETGDADLTAHLLLDHVIPRVISLRGDLMIHAAGAVGPSGRAHLFLGRTGVGKSTLVTSLTLSGWELLDDDSVRIVQSQDGEFNALPGSGDVRLLPDAAAMLLSGLVSQPISSNAAKRRFTLDMCASRAATQPAAIGAIYALGRGESSEASAQRLTLAEAVGNVTENGFHLADQPAVITRNAFERASALAAAVPVWRLLVADGLERLDQAIKIVSELDLVIEHG